MKIKTSFAEFWFKVEDAEFLLREQDVSELYLGKFTIDNKMKLDMKSVLDDFVNSNILNWKGMTDDNGELIYSADNKKKLPYDLRSILFAEVQKRSSLNDTDKKK